MYDVLSTFTSISLIFIEFYRPPTDAGIEPEESLPFGAVVHGGHIT